MKPAASNAAPPSVADAVVKGRLPAGYLISDTGPEERGWVTDPRSDRRWALGPTELMVARQFDGARTYGEISRVLRERLKKRISPEKLQAFEARLLGSGLLESSEPRLDRDPFTGFHFGWLHRLIVVKLVCGNPQPALDILLRALPMLVSPAWFAAALAFTAGTLFLVTLNGSVLLGEIPAALAGWGTAWLYAVAVSSALFHEGGHAFACLRYGVAVREMGVAIYFLLPFAWTRPDQEAWSRLPLRARLVTIFAGPLGSLLFAALGGLAWLIGAPGEPLRLLGVYALVAGMIGVIPTMLPIFNGDGYLLLTELFGVPNLRRRAFEHLRISLADGARAARIAPRKRLIYLGVSLGTVAGWAAVTALVLWAAWLFSLRGAA